MRGIRPTSLLLRKQPHSKWNELDFLLIEAYQAYEDETSASHGLPIWASRTLSDEIAFLVEDAVDLADRALAEYDDKNKDAKGMARWPVAVDPATDEPIEFSGVNRERFIMAKDPTMDSNIIEIEDGVEIEVLRPGQRYDPHDYGDG